MEDFPPEEIPGTPAYMAPEMFAGEPGNEATDIYALGVTMFRAFTGEFPYGNPDATIQGRRDRPKEFSALRRICLHGSKLLSGGGVAVDPTERLRDMGEFALEMGGTGPPVAVAVRRPRTLCQTPRYNSGRVWLCYWG